MITRYDSLIEFLQDIHSIKNAIVCVTDGFVKEANMDLLKKLICFLTTNITL